MRSTLSIAAAFSTLLMCAAPLAAQAPPEETASGASTTSKEQEEEKARERKRRAISMQHFRAVDQRGINVFETSKEPGIEYTGFKLDFNAAFTSQVQALSHENTAEPVMVGAVNTNQLADIGFGFNNSTANLTLHAQLADGVR